MRIPKAALTSSLMLAVLLAVGSADAEDAAFDLGGHVKPQFAATTYPEDSVFRQVFGTRSGEFNLDARAVAVASRGSWRFDLDGQFIATHGDLTEQRYRVPPEFGAFVSPLPTDRTRLLDLTYVVTNSGRTAALGRLDRLSIGYTGHTWVVRFGRQALSWGNGLVYSAMDIFNPFDPTAIDKEYKSGDDILYGQVLRRNGQDLQGVFVFRRNSLTRNVGFDDGSVALKYHWMAGGADYDLLFAHHYDDTLVGMGGSHDIGGAVWNGDLVLTLTGDDVVFSVVTSLTYSWPWGGRNVTTGIEFFHNGFGQTGEYALTNHADSAELLGRVSRGELFSLGRHHFALTALLEINPLLRVTPSVLVNADDPSAFFQVIFQGDLKQDLVLTSSVSMPIGAHGSEFGGVRTKAPDLVLSTGLHVFVQAGWYW